VLVESAFNIDPVSPLLKGRGNDRERVCANGDLAGELARIFGLLARIARRPFGIDLDLCIGNHGSRRVGHTNREVSLGGLRTQWQRTRDQPKHGDAGSNHPQAWHTNSLLSSDRDDSVNSPTQRTFVQRCLMVACRRALTSVGSS
jgi:hypothetical protein